MSEFLSGFDLRTLVLVTGWPMLLIVTALILNKSRCFYLQLKKNLLGRLIWPTVGGWLFGLFALGAVSTAYMFNLPWQWTVLPAFWSFLIMILVLIRTINKWEKQALELQAFYTNLEKLVKERTQDLEESFQEDIQHEKEIQKLKDEFVHIAAHELKTPVTAIKWSLETALSEGAEKFEPSVLESLKNVQSSNERLISLVDDLLNVARIEAGTIKINQTEFEAGEAVREVLAELAGIFKSRQQTVEFFPQQSFMVLADRDRYKQVVVNLLSNASKYSPEKTKIEVELTPAGKLVETSVKDHGFGIGKKDMDKLFTKFGRIRDADTSSIEGNGLGLYFCQQIVNKMGGKMTAVSQKGKGSTFSFSVMRIKS